MEDQAATTTTTTVATASAAAPTAPRPAMTTAAAAPAATANGHAASSPGPARISPASAVDALRQGGGGGSASCPASPSPSAFVSALPTRQSSAPPTPAKPGAVTPRKLRCPEPQHSSGASSTSSTPGSPLSPNRHSRVESAPVRLPSSSGPVAHPKRWSSSPRTQPFTPTPASPKWTKSAYWRKFPRMPLVRVAKKLLAQLETLWSEVTGQDVDGAAFSPGPPLPTSPSSSSIAPKSNTPTAFFLHSIPPDFRPLNPSGLEDGPALNDEALSPIVKSLEKLVDEEIHRRDTIIHEISKLEAEITSLCGRLGTPVEPQLAGHIASVYRRRDLMKAHIHSLEKLVTERENRISDLKLAISKAREELEDLLDDEFILDAGDDLRLETIEAHVSIRNQLRGEKESRLTKLATIVSKLCLVYRDIELVPETEEDHQLAAHLSLLSPPSERTVQTNSTGESELVPDDILLSQAKLLFLPPLPAPFSIRRSYISDLELRLTRFSALRNEAISKCEHLIKEITMFWEELETPFHQQIDLELNLRRLEEFGALADRLRTDWKLQKEEKLAKLVARLNELWKLCHLSEVEKESLSQQLATNLYSPLTLDAISSEIAVLEDRYKKEAPLYKAIHDRKCYIQKLIDFEKNASDPRRLFLPSFRLLEEEKFRRNGIPTLLAIESKLRSSVTKFEADHSRPFTYNGKRWLDVMDQEISERFLSDSFLTFEVQPGHQRSSSSGGGTSKQSSPKIISPVLQTPRRSSNRSQSPVVTPKSIPNSASKTPVTPGKRSASRPKTAPSRAEAQSQKPTRPIVGTKAPPPAGKVTAAMAAAVGGRGRGLGRGEGGGGASEVDVVARAADI